MSGLAKRMRLRLIVVHVRWPGVVWGYPVWPASSPSFTTFIGAYSIFPLATILCVCTIAITARLHPVAPGGGCSLALSEDWRDARRCHLARASRGRRAGGGRRF